VAPALHRIAGGGERRRRRSGEASHLIRGARARHNGAGSLPARNSCELRAAHWERVYQRGIMYSKDIAAMTFAPFPSGEEDPTIEGEGRTVRLDAVPARPFVDWVGPGSGRPVVYRRPDARAHVEPKPWRVLGNDNVAAGVKCASGA